MKISANMPRNGTRLLHKERNAMKARIFNHFNVSPTLTTHCKHASCVYKTRTITMPMMMTIMTTLYSSQHATIVHPLLLPTNTHDHNDDDNDNDNDNDGDE